MAATIVWARVQEAAKEDDAHDHLGGAWPNPKIDDGAIVPSAVFAQIVIRCVWLLRLLPPSGLSRP
ncbi:MAG: hypothetical protein K5Q68_01900, partial [Roseococcus sp.]|nr:hypothetical protein [Roseococcus sp.]